MQLRRAVRGFSLVELAVVLAIVALLIGSAMMTLSAQVETRNNDETVRRLNAAADAIVAFAIVNRRLPCPARFAATHSSGLESFCTAATGTCAVARNKAGCTTSPGTNHVFTAEGNMRTYGVGCRPNDLDVCTTAACAARVVSQDTAVLVVFSTGKNGAIAGAHGADETENIDGDAVFVNRTPSGADSAGGAYDDLMVIVPVGVVYSKLISAGVLP